MDIHKQTMTVPSTEFLSLFEKAQKKTNKSSNEIAQLMGYASGNFLLANNTVSKRAYMALLGVIHEYETTVIEVPQFSDEELVLLLMCLKGKHEDKRDLLVKRVAAALATS